MGVGYKRKRLLLCMGKKRSDRERETEREGKMERMGREGRDVMRHCMVVKREMGEVESTLCLIE